MNVKRSKSSQLVLQFGGYLKKNWANLMVLGFVLSLSASASIIIYKFAMSDEMLLVALGDIQNRVESYLTASTAIIPAAKAFLQARQIDTGDAPHPDIITASRLWGYFFNTTANTANSLFYLDKYGNNLGWGWGGTEQQILLQWTSIVPGVNVYEPVNGAIGNISAPLFHQDSLISFPPLAIENKTGQPYWQSVYLLKVANLVQPLISYSEPAYFNDNNEFCCIVGTNIYINAFEGVLGSYNIAKDSRIYLTDVTGTLIADSEGGLKIYLDGLDSGDTVQLPSLPNATQHPDAVIAASANFLIDKFGSFEQIPLEDQHLSFKYHGSTQIVLIGQYQRDNFILNIVIVVPYDSFFAKIEFSKRLTIAFTVIAVVSGFLRYVIAWRLMGKISPGQSQSSIHSAGYPSTINVALSQQHSTHHHHNVATHSTTSSTTSLFHESPNGIRRQDIFGENNPAILEKDLP